MLQACIFGEGLPETLFRAQDVGHMRKASVRRTAGIPVVPGRPVIGNTLEFLDRPLGFFIDAYHTHGPVFRMSVPMTRAVVVAGEAAEQVLRAGAPNLERTGLFRPFAEEVGVDVFERAGPEHRRVRGLLRLPYSKQVAAQFVAEMAQVVDDMADHWHPGEQLDLFAVASKLALHASMAVVTPMSLRDWAEDISRAGNAVMYAAFRLLPESTLKIPGYRRARLRMQQIIDEAIARHRRGDFNDDPRTYMIDACLQAGGALDHAAIRGACFYALAGSEIYIGRLVGFMMFELLKNPRFFERVVAEVDQAWALDNGPEFRRMPYLRAAYFETLRCYPLIPAFPYRANADTMISGHAIANGQLLLLVPHIAHFTGAHYDNPLAFDPMRHLPPRRESANERLFAAFGLGAHACSAQGMVEQLALTLVCALIRRVRLEPVRPSLRLQLRMTPLLAPHTPILLRAHPRGAGHINGEISLTPPDFHGPTDWRHGLTKLPSQTVVSAQAGTVLQTAGEPVTQLVVILAGEVAAESDAGTFILRAGHVIGEQGLLKGSLARVTYRAQTEVSMVVLSSQEFVELVTQHDLTAADIAALAMQTRAGE